LVFSTLHTNDAPGAVTRLIDIGIKPFLVASATRCLMAQRLVRKVCKNCYGEYEANEEEKAFLGVPVDEPYTLAKGKGCDICNNTGHKGQLGVFEILEVTRSIKELINLEASSLTMLDAAQKGGMVTLLDDGKRKARNRLTSVDEVIRVLGKGMKED
jgi:type IV pilus assembly protein PilB